MTCTFRGCGKPAYCKGLCKGHYAQAHRGLRLRPLRLPGGRKAGVRLRVSMMLPEGDVTLLRNLARSHKVLLAEVVSALVDAALDQGVEVDL